MHSSGQHHATTYSAIQVPGATVRLEPEFGYRADAKHNVPEPARINQRLRDPMRSRELFDVSNHELHFGFCYGTKDSITPFNGLSHWLLKEDVLASLGGPYGDLGVQVVGYGNDYCVDVSIIE